MGLTLISGDYVQATHKIAEVPVIATLESVSRLVSDLQYCF